MNFWKEHLTLRGILILLFFVLGIVLTVVGWKMTGKLEGLGLMLVGIVFLLVALFVYNAAYKNLLNREGFSPPRFPDMLITL